MDTTKRPYSAYSALLCIYSPSFVLGIWNFLRDTPLWGFPSESSEPHELVTDTLVRAGIEEAGFEIPVQRDELGVITKLGDEATRVTLVLRLLRQQYRQPHWKYFYTARISDARLLSLSDKLLHADTDELLWTWAFPFKHVFTMQNFHQGHLKLLNRAIDQQRYAA